MKCCSKCNIEKDDGQFYSERNICKICEKQQNKQYYQNNTEAIKERKKQWYQNNTEAIKERNKQYRQNNLESVKEREKQYRQNNREAIKERKKQYYQNNLESIKERKKQYRQNNRESIKKQNKQYYENNLNKQMLKRARKRAKQKNIPFNLNEEDIDIPDVCPVLGIPLEAGIGKGIVQLNSPSLDRIIPEKGYIKGNIIVVSHRANTIKTNATPEEIIAVGEYYKKMLEEAKKNE